MTPLGLFIVGVFCAALALWLAKDDVSTPVALIALWVGGMTAMLVGHIRMQRESADRD